MNAIDRAHLAIVCPMANERATALSFIRETLARARQFESVRMFVVFDRASTDGTYDLLREAARADSRIVPLWAAESRCVVDAYVRGYREALASGCEWILEIDAGFSHQPRDIAAFVEQAKSGSWDCIFGSRFCARGSITESSLKRRALSWTGTQLSNLLLGTQLRDMTSGFQLFRHSALAEILAVPLRSRGHFFQTEMKYRSRHLRICEVPITYRAASPSVKMASILDALTVLAGMWCERVSRIRPND